MPSASTVEFRHGAIELLLLTWDTSENNRRAKFYQLTAKGREELAEDTQDWWRYAAAVGKVLKSTSSPVTEWPADARRDGVWSA